MVAAGKKKFAEVQEKVEDMKANVMQEYEEGIDDVMKSQEEQLKELLSKEKQKEWEKKATDKVEELREAIGDANRDFWTEVGKAAAGGFAAGLTAGGGIGIINEDFTISTGVLIGMLTGALAGAAGAAHGSAMAFWKQKAREVREAQERIRGEALQKWEDKKRKGLKVNKIR